MPRGRGKKGQTIENQEKARQAAELKIAGWSWERIAKELGWKNRATPMRVVEKYFEEQADRQWQAYFPVLNERAEFMWRQAQMKILEGQRDKDDVKWERGMRQGNAALQYLARITGVDEGLAVQVNVAVESDVERLRHEFVEIERQRALSEGVGDVVDAEVVDDDGE